MFRYWTTIIICSTRPIASTPKASGEQHLLFRLSLIPFVTSWMGERFAPLPVAAYGVVQLAAIAFYILVGAIRSGGGNSRLAEAVGSLLSRWRLSAGGAALASMSWSG
jgi:hypothetical protein